jgi:hypothetical protein
MVHAVDPNGPAFPPPPVQEDSPFLLPTGFAATQHSPGASHDRGPRFYHLIVARATTAVLTDPASAVAGHILIDCAHMCPHRECFTQIRPCAPSHILLGDDSNLVCQEEGTIHFTVHSGTHPFKFCCLIPSTLPRCAIHSFCAVRSLPRPCTPIFLGPLAQFTMFLLHHPLS